MSPGHHGKARGKARTILACAAVSLALYAAFCGPVLAHFRSAVPYGSYAAEKEPLELVQGDHLQLLYHFDLFDAYLSGRLPWFRNLWEFNTGDASRPAKFDPCYAPFALPYSLLRRAGASDAAAWNSCQALSVFLGVLFCYALARRFGAGRLAALSAAAAATCVPYRWVVLTGGSPTGFGMGLVPAVALGIDSAVRDRKLRGGLLAGFALAACYATDLHCYLFAAMAAPLWAAAALLRSPDNPFARRRRFWSLALAVSPVAAGAAATAALGAWAKRAYAGTSVSAGRTLREIAVHSPDWHSFFDPFHFSHSPEQFHMGFLLPALLLAAGAAVLAAAALAVFRALRPARAPAFESPAIVFHPAFWSRRTDDGPGPASRLAAALPFAAALLLAAAILFVFLLALGVNGPFDGAPLRLVRKLVPPFRMVRQPLKAFCLLPSLYAAFFASGLAAARHLSAALAERRTAARPAQSRLAAARSAAGAKAGAGSRAARRRRAAAAAACFAVPVAAYFSVSGGMRAGACILPGPNAAYGLAVADALARGIAKPRAIALPIWPGDSSWSSLYEYPAARAGLRMLNGYAAVTDKLYVERVFRAFETMTEGDLTDAQMGMLRRLRVSDVILHENAFPAKVSPFPFGATLRRFLADPRLRFLGEDGGAWAFAIDYDAAAPAGPAETPFAEPPFFAPTKRADVSPPSTNAAMSVRSLASIRSEGFGWLVRAESGKDLVLAPGVMTAGGVLEPTAPAGRFPAIVPEPGKNWPPHRLAWIPAGPAGIDMQTRLLTPGEALVTHVAYTAATNFTAAPGPDGAVFLPAPDMEHSAGTTVLSGPADAPSRLREPVALRFEPGRTRPRDEVLAGPSLPLPFPPGQYLATLETAGAAGDALWFSAVEGAMIATPRPAGAKKPAAVHFHYDGTTPVRFRVSCDPSRGAAELRGIRIVPRVED